MGFKLYFNNEWFYGVLDENTKDSPPKIFPNSDGGVTIIADEKYNFKKKLEAQPPQEISEFWQIKVTEALGGGGAHNTAFGQQVYLNPTNDPGIKIRLIVPIGHSLIKNRLPQGLEYIPLYGMNDSNVPVNLNFAPANGKKITLRAKVETPPSTPSDLGIKDGDVVVLNTVRDKNYLDLLEQILYSNTDVKLFLAATDSMMGSLGIEKVWELVKRSDIYVSNREELEKLVGVSINEPKTLSETMSKVQSSLFSRDGSPGRVYITFGQYGSAALGADKVIIYQTVAQGETDPFNTLKAVNTNGCGDAYISVVVIKEILGHPTIEILDHANSAGHICATRPAASGAWMATESSITEFRSKYGKPDFHRYDTRKKEFIRMRV